MSNEIQKEDRLAERIRKRREHAGAAKPISDTSPVAVRPSNAVLETPKPVENPLPKIESTFDRPNLDVKKMIALAVEAIDQNENPLKVAKMLLAIQATGLKSQELATELRKSKAWVSKRLGLLKAPDEIQQRIESGLLSEHEFYNHRARVEAEASRTKRQTLQYARMPTVTISIEAAHALAGILKNLTVKHGLNPIALDQKTGKKELVSILNLRPFDILKAIK